MESILGYGAKRSSLGSFSFDYFGSLPENAIFFCCKLKSDLHLLDSLYLSALEAALNGFDVLYVSGNKASKAIESGVRDGLGRLFALIPFDIGRLYMNVASTILKSNGGLIVPTYHDDMNPNDAINLIGVQIARAIILANSGSQSIKYLPHIKYALDNSKDIAVLKDGLDSNALKSLVLDGCPLINSFSDFLSFPKAIGYRSDKGIYGKGSARFDIIYFNGQ